MMSKRKLEDLEECELENGKIVKQSFVHDKEVERDFRNGDHLPLQTEIHAENLPL